MHEFEMKDSYEVKKNRKGTDYIVNETGEVVAKHCTKCGESKWLREFNTDKKGFMGKTSSCNLCAKRKTEKWRTNNPNGKTNWYNENKNNPEYKKRKSVSDKKWRTNNPEKYKNGKETWYKRVKNTYEYKEKRSKNDKKFREDNPNYYKNYGKHWRSSNPEKTRVYSQRKLARKRSLPDTLTHEQDKYIKELQNHNCILSGDTVNLHLEHFLATASGSGGTTFENCYYMEGSINQSKGDKIPFEWIKEQPEEYQDNFYNKLVPMMAERNNMTVKEFTDFTYHCYYLKGVRDGLFSKLGFTIEGETEYLKQLEACTPIEKQIQELTEMVNDMIK